MEWWTALGNMSALMPDAPALAHDFAFHGPHPDGIGYGLAYGVQDSPMTFDLYPEEPSAPLEG